MLSCKTGCVTLGTCLSPSVLQVSSWRNVDNNSIYLLGLLWGLNLAIKLSYAPIRGLPHAKHYSQHFIEVKVFIVTPMR